MFRGVLLSLACLLFPAQACRQKDGMLSCIGDNLTSPPTGPDVFSLDLSNNFLRSDNSWSLLGGHFPHLVFLNLSKNYLEDIHEYTFSNLTMLELLDLSFNNLQHVSVSSFIMLPSLRTLNLSNNPITLPYKGNFLSSLSLEELDISRCNLTYLPSQAFLSVPQLKELYLSGNNIKIIEEGTISPLRNLLLLDLTDNLLSTFTYKDLLDIRNETLMKTSGNPWSCDCILQRTYSWCRSVRRNLDLICDSPNMFHGSSWDVVRTLDCNEQPIAKTVCQSPVKSYILEYVLSGLAIAAIAIVVFMAWKWVCLPEETRFIQRQTVPLQSVQHSYPAQDICHQRYPLKMKRSFSDGGLSFHADK